MYLIKKLDYVKVKMNKKMDTYNKYQKRYEEIRPPPTYLIPSPTKKLVTPKPLGIPSIIRLSKKETSSDKLLIPLIKNVE